MKTAIEHFGEFFEKQGWSHHQSDDKSAIQINITGKNGRWVCMAVADVEGESVAFISLFPSRALPQKQAACAELLMRINFGLKHGAFEMDFEDGEIRFRTALPIAPAEVTPAMIERMVGSNLLTCDAFYDPIMRVLHGGSSPKEALAKEEEKPSTQPRFELN